jgi:ankyrin repeat protein
MNLHEMIYYGDADGVKTWVLAHPESVNSSSPTGLSALDAAIEADNADILRFLLEHGADPNSLGGANCPPIHLAIDAAADILLNSPPDADPPSMEIIKLLVSYGADLDKVDRHNQNALVFSSQRYQPAYDAIIEQLSKR